MHSQQFALNAKKALNLAEEAAREMKNSFIGTEHLLLGILKIKNSSLNKALKNSDVTYEGIKEDIIALFGFCEEKNSEPQYTRTMEEILDSSVIDAKMSGKQTADLDTLTLCLLQAPNNVAAELLRRYGLDIGEVIERIKMEDISSLNKIQELTNLNEKMKKQKTSLALREKQLDLIMQILCRKEKGNPLLLGEPGVGKTAIVEELARRIAVGKVPDALKNTYIYELNINCLVAGTKYRGEFEEKIQKIISALQQFPQVILFIDEIHQMVGAGKAEGSIDVAGVLKTHLARGKIRCIGSTTYEEYVRFIEKDRALQRRFQIVMIEEPTFEEACAMVNCRLEEYRQFHQVEFGADLVEDLVKKSEYYLPERKLPDKAIDIVDLCCVNAKMEHRQKVSSEDILKTIENMTSIPLVANTRSAALCEKLDPLINDQTVLARLKQSIQWLDLQVLDEKPLASWVFKGSDTELKKEIVKLIAKVYFIQNERLSWLDMQQAGRFDLTVRNSFNESMAPWLRRIKRNPYSILCIEHFECANEESAAFVRKVLEQGKAELADGSEIDFHHALIIILDDSKKRDPVGFHAQAHEIKDICDLADEVFELEGNEEQLRKKQIRKRMDFYADQLGKDKICLNENDFIGLDEKEIDKKIKEKITKLLIKSS